MRMVVIQYHAPITESLILINFSLLFLPFQITGTIIPCSCTLHGPVMPRERPQSTASPPQLSTSIIYPLSTRRSHRQINPCNLLALNYQHHQLSYNYNTLLSTWYPTHPPNTSLTVVAPRDDGGVSRRHRSTPRTSAYIHLYGFHCPAGRHGHRKCHPTLGQCPPPTPAAHKRHQFSRRTRR